MGFHGMLLTVSAMRNRWEWTATQTTLKTDCTVCFLDDVCLNTIMMLPAFTWTLGYLGHFGSHDKLCKNVHLSPLSAVQHTTVQWWMHVYLKLFDCVLWIDVWKEASLEKQSSLAELHLNSVSWNIQQKRPLNRLLELLFCQWSIFTRSTLIVSASGTSVSLSGSLQWCSVCGVCMFDCVAFLRKRLILAYSLLQLACTKSSLFF